jgi:hypothetical protein
MARMRGVLAPSGGDSAQAESWLMAMANVAMASVMNVAMPSRIFFLRVTGGSRL